MYAMLGIRFDLACGISVISQFLEKPKAVHVQLVQHMLKYLKANLHFGLIYRSSDICLSMLMHHMPVILNINQEVDFFSNRR